MPAVAVLCSSMKLIEEFDMKHKDAYKYELLGGQHTALARKEIAKKFPDYMLLQQIHAEVYIGLTNDEALRLASRHNVNGHFVHRMTHRDYVSQLCISLFTIYKYIIIIHNYYKIR